MTVSGARRWSGGAQTVTLTVSDASGAAFSQVLLDGAPVAELAARSRSPARARTCCARSPATAPATRRSPSARSEWMRPRPSSGRSRADFVARELRFAVADALAGVALAEVRLGGTALETRISADGTHRDRTRAGGRRPGRRRRRRARAGRVQPRQRGRAQRDAAGAQARGPAWPERRRRSRERPRGRRSRPRVRVWAYPKGRAPRPRGHVSDECHGSVRRSRRARRTTRYAVAVPESQELRGLTERSAGTVGVTARIEALTIRVRGDRLVVHARFAGRGEATRLHLLVHDLRGGRWVEGVPRARQARRPPRAHGPRLGQLHDPAERPRPRLDVPPRPRRPLHHVALAHALERLGERAPAALSSRGMWDLRTPLVRLPG